MVGNLIQAWWSFKPSTMLIYAGGALFLQIPEAGKDEHFVSGGMYIQTLYNVHHSLLEALALPTKNTFLSYDRFQRQTIYYGQLYDWMLILPTRCEPFSMSSRYLSFLH